MHPAAFECLLLGPAPKERPRRPCYVINFSLDLMTASDPSPTKQASDDGPTPPKSTSGPMVVGIGASAGGLAALKNFFSHTPPNSGLAFVVIVHLSPDHVSHLPDLLQPHAQMPVIQVNESVPLEANRVYVIPPAANLDTIDTHLRLSPLEINRLARAPIDHFFRTLAKTHDGKAIGVILSGTGSDGALGIREIKEAGGLAIVQDPNEAEFDGMPQSAIATGAVDLVLPLEKIPGAIADFVRIRPALAKVQDDLDAESGTRQVLQRMFALLRARTGRDFSRYKPATILRRITRRMQLRHVEQLPAYLDLMREDAEEAPALADDLLINVTSFFRDREVFEALEREVIPKLFEGKSAEDNIRIWSVGCSTGEEAYSLAILLLEATTRHDLSPRIQIFATELHERSLERAREGFYPGDIETDVSEDRLKRFFQKENGGYRVRKEVRELVVFAPHNILSDPPFSRVDLISCRNLLIYLQREVQKEVLEIFHYSLDAEGFLLLGTSETTDTADLFLVQDKKRCLFRKRNVRGPDLRLPVFPLTRKRVVGEAEFKEIAVEPLAYGALHQRMVEQVAPPSILVSPDDKVVHLSTHAGRYLEHPGGELTANVFKLLREELRIELRAALSGCRNTHHPLRTKPVWVRFNGNKHPVVMQVRPALDSPQEGFVLVIFEEWEEAEAAAVGVTEGMSAPIPQSTLDAEAELQITRQRLQAIIEEFETSQEELKASNEEMQSANEELRSTMEELETSKEELQSMNEELQTVNQENRHKVEELAQLSGDLQNLLSATDIATLFLDRRLCILRFTPKVSELFNVRMTDRGRPLSNFTRRLGYDELERDAQLVLDHLVPIEREVQDEEGRWYLTRVRPYPSTEDRIEGIVTTFVDITERVRAETALRASQQRLQRMVNLPHVGVLTYDADGSVLDANDAFLAMVGYDREAFKQRKFSWRDFTPQDYVEASLEILKQFKETGRGGPYEKEYFRRDGSRIWMMFVGAQLDDGTIVEYALDISDRKRAEEALRESQDRLRLIVESAMDFAIITMDEGRFVKSWSPGAESLFGYSTAEIVDQSGDVLFTPEDRAACAPEKELQTALSEGRALDERWHLRKDGSRFFASGVMRPLNTTGPERVAKIMRDLTQRKQSEDALRDAQASLETRVHQRTAELAAANDALQEEISARSQLQYRFISAQEEERLRISRELHDGVGQLITALLLRLKSIQNDSPAPLSESISSLSGMVDEIAKEVHKVAVELRPTSLSDVGLVAALGAYLDSWSTRHGIRADFHADNGLRLSLETEAALYRIAQEAVTNVLKHAQATQVSVVLERKGKEVVLMVEDNGIGFDVDSALRQAQASGRLGLMGMRERVEAVGGALEIESNPDAPGTTVYVRIPLASE